jgi:hypothetical protein
MKIREVLIVINSSPASPGGKEDRNVRTKDSAHPRGGDVDMRARVPETGMP